MDRACLDGADLRGANMYGAGLFGTVFRAADLRDAVLRDAAFSETDFRGADLRGADAGHRTPFGWDSKLDGALMTPGDRDKLRAAGIMASGVRVAGPQEPLPSP